MDIEQRLLEIDKARDALPPGATTAQKSESIVTLILKNVVSHTMFRQPRQQRGVLGNALVSHVEYKYGTDAVDRAVHDITETFK